MTIAALACWIALTIWGWLELGFSGLVPLSTGLTVGILYATAMASRTSSWPLFKLLLQLYAGVNVLNIQIENLVFGTASPGEIARTTVTGLLAAIIVSAALASASTRGGRAASSAAHAPLIGKWWWKLPVLGLVYVVLFLIAGALIYPYIREFYDRNPGIAIPSFGVLVLTEFIRGLVHVVALWPFLQMMNGRRAPAALLAGVALAILGGISSLLLPIDDILPLEIRRVHIVEIFGSNLLFGVITACLLVPRDASYFARARTNGSAPAPCEKLPVSR